jgi:hypothetical protein
MSRQSYEVATTRQGHIAAVNLYQHHVKPHTSQGGAGRLTWEPIDAAHRHQLRKLFHGPVLADFSEQVKLFDPECGLIVRYTKPVWKQHLTDQFCPAQFDADGQELEKSTERMSDDEFATFLLEVQAYGAMELDITFTEQVA